MRQIGKIENQLHADRFIDFLLSQQIDATTEQDESEWVIWVRDEDQLDEARRALANYLDNPEDSVYVAASVRAESIRREQQTRSEQQTRRENATPRVNTTPAVPRTVPQPLPRRIPLTVVLISISIGVTLFSDFGQQRYGSPARELAFCDRSHSLTDFDSATDGWTDIKAGEVWRVVTPIFLHYDILHIGFNMLMFLPLAAMIESRKGSPTLGLIVLLVASVSNIGQYMVGNSPWFGGMSGVVYGLLGFIWIRMLRYPAEGLRVQSQTIIILVAWMILGFSGGLDQMLDGSVANWAHLFGLLAGMAIAVVLPTSNNQSTPAPVG